MNLNKYAVIILDCDGVVFDSNLLKLDAFKSSLYDFNENIVSSFLEYFKNNFGTSRYFLTKVFINDFLKVEFDEKLYQSILDKYSSHCVQLYKNSDLTISFLDFIEKYQNKRIYVASGSDEKELKQVFNQRDLTKYFVDIFGSPTKKSEIVKKIVSDYPNSVMIGDAKSDMSAAKENNIDFIFMKDYSTNENMKNDKRLVSINNLGDLI